MKQGVNCIAEMNSDMKTRDLVNGKPGKSFI